MSSEQKKLCKPKLIVIGKQHSRGIQAVLEALEQMGELTFVSENEYKPEKFLSFFFAGNFDGIIFPNPYNNTRRRNIYLRARRLGVPVIVYDRGGLPNTWFFDSGFNADSPSFRASRWDSELEAGKTEEVVSYLSDLKSHEALENQGEMLSTQELRNKYSLGDKKVLFVPLQRPSDTVMKFFSGNVRSILKDGHFSGENMFAEIEQLAKIAEEALPDWAIVVKKHPLEAYAPDIRVTYVDHDEHVNSLLELSSAVACVNSGVGLLALAYGKRVFHFGQTYYTHPKLTTQIRDADDLVANLKAGLPTICDDTRNRLFYHLLNRVYSIGKFHTHLEEQPDGSYHRITTKIDFDELRYPEISSERSQRKRCLFVSPLVPIRRSRGSDMRTCQMLRSLAASGYTVDFVGLNPNMYNLPARAIEEELRHDYPFLGAVKIVHHPRVLKNSRKKQDYWKGRVVVTASSLAKKLCYPFRKYRGVRTFKDQPLDFIFESWRFARRRDYDLVFVNYAKMTMPWLDQIEAPKVVDSHDVQTQIFDNEKLPKIKKESRRKELREIFENSETYLLGKFDRVITISSDDEEYMETRWNLPGKVSTINASMPNGKSANNAAVEGRMLFVGSGSPPNIAALEWLLRDVFPKLANPSGQELVLDVLGDVAKVQLLSEYFEREKIGPVCLNLIGRKPVLEGYFSRASVVLAPLVRGTGMKIKVVEALAYGKPIIGTSVAFQGIDVEDGVHALRRDGAEAFAQGLTELLNDPAARAQLSKGSKEFFEQNFTQAASDAALARVLEGL